MGDLSVFLGRSQAGLFSKSGFQLPVNSLELSKLPFLLPKKVVPKTGLFDPISRKIHISSETLVNEVHHVHSI